MSPKELKKIVSKWVDISLSRQCKILKISRSSLYYTTVMHSHVTHNRHYPTQKHFANAILNFMREVLPKEWLSYRDQVTDNFRIISHHNVRILQ
ncbi:hypothetical protein N9D61_01515 [Planktomarina sp.]|jgi:hypothetical protein|nr:hypothetical protein [Planktomarina sp.]